MTEFYEREEKTLNERLKQLEELIEQTDKKKIKKLKLPRKARVKKGKLKKGWIGVLKIEENGNISGEKVKVEGSTFVQKDDIIHATTGQEVLFWEGKFPVVIQPSWKNNPVDVRKFYKEETNETYGQPYIKARLLKDVIKPKRTGGGSIIWIIAIVAIGYFVLSKFHVFG